MYIGLEATTWVLVDAQLPVLSPNDHPNSYQGGQKSFGKSRSLKVFQVPLNNSPSSTKTAKSSPARAWGRGGGGVQGGGQNFFAYCGCCVWIGTRALNNFFLVY